MTVIEGHSDRWTVMEVDNCPPVRTDLSVEFHSRHRDVVFAGGRRGSVRLTDLREATTKPGLHWRHAAAVGAAHASSAVTHLRSVDDNHVLVAGLRSTMCLYDIRCLRTPRQPLCRLFSSPASSKSRYPRSIMAGESYRPCVDEATVDTGVYPVVTFPDYQNEAHIRTGLDVLLPSSARGLCPGGLVAAAHDDGTVAIYSLRTGRRLTWDHSLRDGKTRNLRKGLISTANRPPQASLLPPDRPTTVADIRRDTPVRCLQFATLPRPKRGESVDRDFTKWVRDWRNRGSSASHQESPRTFDDDDGEEYSDQKQLRDGGLFGQFGPDYGSFPSLFVGEGECIVEYAVGGGVAVDEW